MASYDGPDRKFQGGTSDPPDEGLRLWLPVAGVALAVGEALYQAGLAGGAGGRWGWLAGVAVLGLGAAVHSWRIGSRLARTLASALALLAVLFGVAAWRTLEVARAPAAAAATAATRAVVRRDHLLSAAVAAARRVGTNALLRVGTTGSIGAPSLDDLLGGGPIEMGVAVLSGDTVLAVAGPQRAGIVAAGTNTALVIGPFARLLVVSTFRGTRRAQVTMLLDAGSALPAPGKSLAEESGRWRMVGWQWHSPTGEHAFARPEIAIAEIGVVMQPVAPSAAQLDLRELLLARWLALAGLVVLAAIVLGGKAPPIARASALLLPLWVAARGGVFPASVSGALVTALLSGCTLLLLAVVLWRRPTRRSAIGIAAAVILLAVAPLLVLRAAPELAPPPGADAVAVWFACQALLALATCAYLALASAPLRDVDDAERNGRWGALATAAALAVGLLGIEAWTPASGTGWPWWYPAAWLVPFALMLPRTSPRARRIAIFTTAATLAALGAWGASLTDRLNLSRDDVGNLGVSRDPITAAALDSLGAMLTASGSTELGQVYASWHASPMAAERIPTQLAVWVDTTVVDWVALDSLAPSWGDLQRVVAESSDRRTQVPLARGEGRHLLLVVPLSGDTAVTVLAGPRSRLVRPTRFGRMIDWRSSAEPPYQLSEVRPDQALPDFTFRRTGRHLRADQWIGAGGRPLVVRATVSIAAPQPFAVRAALIVLLDVVAAIAAWWLVERFLGLQSGGEPDVFRRSYRRTVTAALISFFVVPAAFFTLWSALRLRQDVAHDRGEEVTRVLHAIDDEPVLVESGASVPASAALAQIADRVDAEVAVYRSGRLVTASAPLLAELGLLSPVIDPAIVRVGPADARDLAAPVPGANVRLGGQATVTPGVVVAAALPGGEADLERDQVDLALLLLLASLGGTIAAVSVAGAVARALGQPIEALRRRALAIGRRELAAPLRDPPAEFLPVFGAIAQMERDLRQSEALLEEETARTARVIAWGEMARQVAHEIKNPLTPMRLGLQHLQRLGADGRPDLAAQTTATAERLLGEIDRLDRIARSFARYGTPPKGEAGALEPVDLGAVATEMAQLYSLGATQVAVTVEGGGGIVPARSEELMQVLLNLLDNAREAGATSIAVRVDADALEVRDNGPGIPTDQHERIFEPTFSTTTSGTGLGLAIVRRLVEGWGGSVTAGSGPAGGAVIRIDFAPADSTPSGGGT